jgi:hypothetical protein
VPKGVACRASATLRKGDDIAAISARLPAQETYRAILADRKEKSGELFVGIDKRAWATAGTRADK